MTPSPQYAGSHCAPLRSWRCDKFMSFQTRHFRMLIPSWHLRGPRLLILLIVLTAPTLWQQASFQMGNTGPSRAPLGLLRARVHRGLSSVSCRPACLLWLAPSVAVYEYGVRVVLSYE